MQTTHKFPIRYTSLATTVAELVSDLWLDGKLTSRSVRYHLRKMLSEKGINATLSSGAFRTTIILPKGVIKVPHDESSIKSTITESKLFAAIRKNKHIAQHFPISQLIHSSGFSVILQERVRNVATEEIAKTHPLYNSKRIDERNPIHKAVDSFGKKLGLGDIHMGNYGWKASTNGPYPVFFDCELGTGMSDLTSKQAEKVANKVISWKFPL